MNHGTNAVNSSPSSSEAASPYWTVPQEKPSGFSPFVAFCFTINYIIGCGFLTIPWAFVQGGLLLSTILLGLTAFASDIAKDYLLETMARAEAMLDDELRWIPKKEGLEASEQTRFLIPPALSSKNNGSLVELLNYGSTDDDLLVSNPSPDSLQTRHHHLPPKRYLVRNRKFELNTLCRIYLGKNGLHLFTLFLSAYVIGLCWAYTSVFSSALARAAPVFANGDEDVNYLYYAMIFGAIVVPLSCLELEEQVMLQVTLTGCRFVMLFFMLFTCYQCAEDAGIDLNQQQEGGSKDATLFRGPLGLAKMFPIVIVANMFHHSIPGLSHPVGDKTKLGRIFQSTIFFTSTVYALLGTMLGSAFGSEIEQSSNLHWQLYHGGAAGLAVVDSDDSVRVWWAKTISFFIVIFPACDVVSAYPLNAITLGNNMFGSYFGSRIHEVENNRWLRTLFRLFASVPPVILGIYFRNLGEIADYAGTTGFIISLSIPAMLYLKSKEFAIRKHFLPNTNYTSYGSRKAIALFLFWFGIAMFVCVVVSLLISE